jgi:hypothetical protein
MKNRYPKLFRPKRYIKLSDKFNQHIRLDVIPNSYCLLFDYWINSINQIMISGSHQI